MSLGGGSGSLVINDSSEYDVEGSEEEPNFDVQELRSENLNPSNMRERMAVQQPYLMKGTNMDFSRKRKTATDLNGIMEPKIYTCEFINCPYGDVRRGFQDRTSRDNHQLACLYRSNPSEFGGANFHVNEVKPVIFPQSFVQSKPIVPSVNSVQHPFGLSALGGVPEDGQRMISELMSMYDTTIQSSNKSMSVMNNAVVEDQNRHQPKVHQHDEYMRGPGVGMETSFFQEANLPNIQFDRFKAANSPFETNPNNNFNLMYGSPFDLSSFDYKEDLTGVAIDSHPKQDIPIWFQ